LIARLVAAVLALLGGGQRQVEAEDLVVDVELAASMGRKARLDPVRMAVMMGMVSVIGTVVRL